MSSKSQAESMESTCLDVGAGYDTAMTQGCGPPQGGDGGHCGAKRFSDPCHHAGGTQIPKPSSRTILPNPPRCKDQLSKIRVASDLVHSRNAYGVRVHSGLSVTVLYPQMKKFGSRLAQFNVSHVPTPSEHIKCD